MGKGSEWVELEKELGRDWTVWDDVRQILCARRRELGWPQKKVADLIGTQQSCISDWERGYAVPVSTSLIIWMRALGLRLKVSEPENWNNGR